MKAPPGLRSKFPLTESDKSIAPDLPRFLVPAPTDWLCFNLRDEGNAPWLGSGERAGDRDPELPSPGTLLRGLCTVTTTSTPESSAALVSCPWFAVMAKICPSPSPNVAVLDPLPAPLSGLVCGLP